MSISDKLAEMRSMTLRAVATNINYAMHRIMVADKYGADMDSSRELALSDAAKLLAGELAVLEAKLYELRNK